LVALLATACVSLDKPEVVESCATNGGCQNGAPTPGGRDAAEDGLLPADDPPPVEEGLPADHAEGPDGGRADSAIGSEDASGVEPSADGPASDLRPGSDQGPDAVPDRPTDQGAETADAGRNDVSKDDLTKDDLTKDDLTKDDLTKLDVVRDDVAKDDVTKLDVEGPEAPLDVSPEVGITNCTIFFGARPSTGSQGHPPPAGTAASCMATCDDISGWDCANKDGRTITVNGTAVSCGAAITKKNGYFVFQLGAGSNRDFAIFWWPGSGQWSTSCTAPPDGFFF
jgi:hypothetical protein